MPRARSRKPDEDPGAFLGHYLQLFREAAGIHSQEALAARLQISRSRVSKIETGEEPPDEVLLAKWLEACGVSPDRLAEIVCGLARHREDTTPTWFRDFAEVERSAHTILSWHTMVWPGLSQTEEYARSLLRTMGYDSEVTEARVRARMERQKILDGPLDMIVVVDQSVLYRQVGTPAITAGQLEHVLTLAERDTVSILVVPGGVNAGCVGAMTIASVRGRPDVLVYEGVNDTLTAKQTMLLEAKRIWERIRSDALPRSGSTKAIREALEQCSSQQ